MAVSDATVSIAGTGIASRPVSASCVGVMIVRALVDNFFWSPHELELELVGKRFLFELERCNLPTN